MNYKISRLARCSCLLAALLASICPGHAQEVTARLDGTVKDTAGALVPEAALTARNVSTGVVTTASSDPSGNYVFPSLAPGTYTLSVGK
ncbi:MAG: carboxypeptidase-like regulatory domain-containing protein [Bryobacteraceae bacterium]